MALKIELPVVPQDMCTQNTVEVFLLDGKTFNSFAQALEDNAMKTNNRVRKLLARPKRWH